MAYVINRFDGSPLVVLEDGTLDTSTSLSFLGRNYVGYGEIQNENFLFLLENFANFNPPSRPTVGQTWYNKSTESLNIYTGTTWVPVSAANLSNTEPIGVPGSLWYNTTSSQLFLFNNNVWELIGPEAIAGFGVTKFQATTILDTNNNTRPIIKAIIDNVIFAVCSKDSFEINPSDLIPNFSNQITTGITLASGFELTGNVRGNATSASRLSVDKTINGVIFNGISDIIVKSSTTNLLKKGDYILGTNFDGSAEVTWSVDASSSNSIGKVVARDSNGSFSAGIISADLIGNVVGNVTATTGTSKFNRVEATEFIGATLSGNAFSATKLRTARQINTVPFDGTTNITIPVAASDITGNRLASTVVESSLTSLGQLTSLSIQDSGLKIGNNLDVEFFVSQGSAPTLLITNQQGLKISIVDTKQSDSRADFEFLPSDAALASGGLNDPAFVGDLNSKCNIGLPTRTFGNVYSDFFVGIATSAQYADLAENYVADADYEPGTVLEFGGEFEVTLATDTTRRVAGIVSTNPAYLMNAQCSGDYIVALALQGRVPCKVRGDIRKGDTLISGGDGYARASSNPLLGTVIGKSLENFEGIEGVIEVAAGRL
jgi:hypothetical protein